MTSPWVALFSDHHGWHERRLQRALQRRNIDVIELSLKDCRFTPTGLSLGERDGLPAAAFVRNVPGGSFEQVTLRLGILHALSCAGVTVYNEARVIEKTVDKSMTSFLLGRAGLPTPPAWACESHRTAAARVALERAAGQRVVLKPLFGACGRGLKLLEFPDQLPPPEGVAGGVYYLQRFVPGDGRGSRDWRVLVVGGEAVAAMERRAAHWITNRARGGQCLAVVLTSELGELARAAAAALGAGYAGVDLVRTGSGELQVLEVNGIPAWRGLQSVTRLDIAQALVDDLLRRLDGARLEAVS